MFSLSQVTVLQFIRRLSMIVQVNVVLNRIVVIDSRWRFDNLCSSHLHSQSELYHVSWWYYTLVIDWIGHLSRNVIGGLSVKPWCYWLWRLIMSLVRFDPSVVTIMQSFIVSQIVSCPVIISWLVLLDSVCKSFVRCCCCCCWLRFSGVCSKFVLCKLTPPRFLLAS